jgi:hypothetical protein
LQGEWIVSLLKEMRKTGKKYINVTKESEETWAEGIQKIANNTLLPSARSWYMGDNITGKKRECLIYLGGVPAYYKAISECAAEGYGGFEIS